MKHVVAEFARDPEWRFVRPPLTAMDDGAAATLLESLRVAQFEMPGYPDPLIVRSRGSRIPGRGHVADEVAVRVLLEPQGLPATPVQQHHQHRDDEYIHQHQKCHPWHVLHHGLLAYLRSDAAN